jgi:heme oxygenase
VLIALVGCDRGCSRAPGPTPPPPTSLAPVPAPQELVAEMVVHLPARTWAELHTSLGSEAVFLPRSIGGLVAGALGLPIRAVQDVDERLPLFAAIDAKARAVAAVHVKDGAALALALSSGPDAQFDLAREGAMSWFTPKPSARTPLWKGVVVGLLHNYLLAGSDREAVAALGPYLARTMPNRHPGDATGKGPAGQADISLHARGGLSAFAGHIEQLAGRVDHGVVEELAPFVDLGAANGALAALGALSDVRASLTLSPTALSLDAACRIGSAIPFADLALIDPKKLVELPDDTLAAISWSETAAGRAARARARSSSIAAKLATKDAALDQPALERSLGDLAAGRGDRATAGIRCTGVGITGFAVGEVGDRDRLDKALAKLIAMRDEPAVKARLTAAGMTVSTNTARIEVVPHDVVLLRVDRGKPGAASVGPIDLRYALAPDRFYAAAGMETIETLQALYRPDAARSLSAKATMATAITANGEPAWISVIADPQGIAACRKAMPGGTFATPVSLTIGPQEGGAKLRIEIARPLLAVVSRTLGR